jgi:hypothetical protein
MMLFLLGVTYRKWLALGDNVISRIMDVLVGLLVGHRGWSSPSGGVRHSSEEAGEVVLEWNEGG